MSCFEQHLSDGSLNYSNSIYLVNHGDPNSLEDRIPLNSAAGPEKLLLNPKARQHVNVRVLLSFPEEQLRRMAHNALRLLREYGLV